MSAWGFPFSNQHHPLILMTDTSLLSWGAHLQTHTVQGKWSQWESTLHINFLELRAVCNACLHFLPITRQKTVRIMMDSIACMFYINRWEEQSQSLCAEALKLWNWCIQHGINISTAYLPGHQNITADSLSRRFSQEHKWEMNHTIHSQMLGIPEYRSVLHT